MSRVLRLTLLAPDIVEAVLDGRQAAGLQLEALLQGLPVEWEGRGADCDLACVNGDLACVNGSDIHSAACDPERTLRMLSDIPALHSSAGAIDMWWMERTILAADKVGPLEYRVGKTGRIQDQSDQPRGIASVLRKRKNPAP